MRNNVARTDDGELLITQRGVDAASGLSLWLMFIGALVWGAALFFGGGCRADSESVVTPGTTSIERREYTLDPDGRPVLAAETKGTATGVGGRAVGDKAAQTLSTGTPTLTLAGVGEAQGGDGDYAAKVTQLAGVSALVWAGIGCCVLALAALYLRLVPVGLGLGGLGVALILAGLYPIFLWLVVLAAVGVGVLWVVRAKKAGTITEALTGVVKGVESAAAEAKAAVKASIDKHTTTEADAAIDAIKRDVL